MKNLLQGSRFAEFLKSKGKCGGACLGCTVAVHLVHDPMTDLAVIRETRRAGSTVIEYCWYFGCKRQAEEKVIHADPFALKTD